MIDLKGRLCYNTVVVEGQKTGFGSRVTGGRQNMKRFYYKFWVPFTVSKKRILILAIASYIALC